VMLASHRSVRVLSPKRCAKRGRVGIGSLLNGA
jgi:hypothetical protein